MTMEDGRVGISPGCRNCPWADWSRWCKSSADSGRLLSHIVATESVLGLFVRWCSSLLVSSCRLTDGVLVLGGLLLTRFLAVSPPLGPVLLSLLRLDCDRPNVGNSRHLKHLHRGRRSLAAAHQRLRRRRIRKSQERKVVTGRVIAKQSQKHWWTGWT